MQNYIEIFYIALYILTTLSIYFSSIFCYILVVVLLMYLIYTVTCIYLCFGLYFIILYILKYSLLSFFLKISYFIIVSFPSSPLLVSLR